jgi:hypothetical protein
LPFTFSHPAIVLPLSFLPKKYYSLTGLIVGSVTPDFEYFLRMKVDSDYSHTISGMFWFDLPLGLLLAFIFHGLVRDPLIANLPGWFQRRMNGFRDFKWKNYFFSNWLIVLISLLIGIASHLFWDSFTHRNGYFVLHYPALANEISLFAFPVTIYHILQHGSSLVGAFVILYAIYLLPENKNSETKITWQYWIITCVILLLTIVIGQLSGQDYKMYGQLFITGISGGLIGLLISSFWWNAKKIK